MKVSKIVLAIAFVAAIFLSGCKSKTCTLTLTNHYDQTVYVYLSQTDGETGKETAAYDAIAPAGKSVSKDGVDVSNMNALIYLGTGETEGDKELMKYKGSMSLKDFAGMKYVKITIDSNGLYGVEGSNM